MLPSALRAVFLPAPSHLHANWVKAPGKVDFDALPAELGMVELVQAPGSTTTRRWPRFTEQTPYPEVGSTTMPPQFGNDRCERRCAVQPITVIPQTRGLRRLQALQTGFERLDRRAGFAQDKVGRALHRWRAD